MSEYDIPPDFECGNRILNVKLRYSAQVRMSKKDFEILKYDIQPQFECQNRILNRMSKCDIRPLFQCQNRILNVEIRYSTSIRMSK